MVGTRKFTGARHALLCGGGDSGHAAEAAKLPSPPGRRVGMRAAGADALFRNASMTTRPPSPSVPLPEGEGRQAGYVSFSGRLRTGFPVAA